MNFAFIKNSNDPLGVTIAHQICQTFQKHGHQLSKSEDNIKFVLNLTDAKYPQYFRRKSKAVFVISLIVVNGKYKNLRTLSYQALVRSLSNLLLCVKTNHHDPEIYFTTPEAGFYHIPFEPEAVYSKILPIAGAHFAIDNRLSTDLPRAYWKSTPIVEKIRQFGRELDQLGVLPAPFPLREVLPEKDIEQLYHLFEVKGISYGNLSAREVIPEFPNATTFWMTARGIDKSNITTVGKDIMLVTGIDNATHTILVSVPPTHDPRARVSVDAVEHELIYRTFPQVGAIIHVHAWMENVPYTQQNYPCGTIELAREVVSLLKQTEDPSQTVVGLKNHGLTITGHNLDEIFTRIRGKLLTQVAMFT
jgi:ribulose-5-phosphate 4-epimerase/fuculose-1-phosphate aldolase